METYSIKCPSCDGYGYVDETRGVSFSTQRICPVCNGSKVVTVTNQPTLAEEGNKCPTTPQKQK